MRIQLDWVALGLLSFSFVFTSALSPSAIAATRIFGFDRYGNTFQLPPTLCVKGGQDLKLLAYPVDRFGNISQVSSFDSQWRMIRQGHPAEDWKPGDFGYTPTFRRGYEIDSVYVTVPFDDRSYSVLQAVHRYQTPAQVTLVDQYTFTDPNACIWAPADLYGGWGTPDQQAPPTNAEGFYPCYGQCVREFKCTDGCPFGAVCQALETPSGIHGWYIRSCSNK